MYSPEALPSPEPEPTSSDAVRVRRSWVSRLRRWFWLAIRSLLEVLLTAWAVLAIYYPTLPWKSARTALAIAFAGFAVWSLWVTRKPRMRWAFAGAFLIVAIWFACLRPSHDRPWRPQVAVMPRVTASGDRVRIDGVRNFDFRSRDELTPRYESREFSLEHVVSLDLFISYWQPGPIAHTFVSFNFDDGSAPLCISIETRPEVGEGFSPVGSMFKKFELIYIVGDEHDLVGSRASARGEDVYLYRIRASRAGVRRLLEIYLERISQLAERPEFYDLLRNSCTVNIFRYASIAGRKGRFDVRQLLNGWVDRYLYNAELVDTSMPFEELRRRSRITEIAKTAAGSPDFSKRIRVSLPHHAQPDR
jgi:hypothetical protein